VVIEDDDAPPSTAIPGATVLLVEDEPMVREVSAAALERLGYRVMQAGDGHAALRRAREHEGRLDLLLTDVVMPGMGGRELAETLLAERPLMAVLYASGYTAETLPDPHLRPGAGQLLRKPYRLADLRAAVEAALERQPRATR
jgi:CheY-like chemotaxis protein